MAHPILLRSTRSIGATSPGCSRCWDTLRSASQERRTQLRSLSSSRTTSYAPSPPQQRRAFASSRSPWYPRSSGGRTSTSTSKSTSVSLYALPARIRTTPREVACFSSSASVRSDAAPSSSTTQSGRPEPPDYLDEKERAIFDKLNEGLTPKELQVEDISGGCGSMYAVAITADKFKGLPVIKQHRLVNEVLGEDIKSWHGIQLRTKAP